MYSLVPFESFVADVQFEFAMKHLTLKLVHQESILGSHNNALAIAIR